MSQLDFAMKMHMEYIVKELGRPFCVRDFKQFEHAGAIYHMSNGTFRNKISQLIHSGKAIIQYKTTLAYYSLPGYEFAKPDSITHDHAGLPIKIGKQTQFYKWLIGRPLSKLALHDIRITFKAENIWKTSSEILPDKIDKNNKDIRLEPWKFLDEIDVNVTVHHTDKVSIAIACSLRPLAIDIPDILYLIEIVTRIEMKLRHYLQMSTSYGKSTSIPRYTNWIVKMWHFGFDVLDRYDGEAFHITFEEGISDLWRIYTKKMNDGTLRPRVEHQEYPNKTIVESILNKIYANGSIRPEEERK
jgi:hypothetical protein